MSSVPATYSQTVLAARPTEHIEPSTFRTEQVPTRSLNHGEARVRVDYISIEPAMRVWLNEGRSYIPPVQIGEIMRGYAVGRVVEVAEGSTRAVGDIVGGLLGWTEYTIIDNSPASASKLMLPPGAELIDLVGVLGPSALTAYFGLYEVGKPKAGETLVVSGAAGAVGSVVCALGKHIGARVVAIAGSEEKCAWLRDSIGVDVTLNYKSDTFKQEWKEKVGLVDVYFDNVGGEMLDFVLGRLREHARIVMCGAISDYNGPKSGIKNYMNVITMRARMEGFVIIDYFHRASEGLKVLADLLASGALVRRFTLLEGLTRAPDALAMLFTGGNTGKTVVKVSDVQGEGEPKASL